MTRGHDGESPADIQSTRARQPARAGIEPDDSCRPLTPRATIGAMPDPVVSGPAGGSAAAERDRRRARQAERQARFRETRPILSRIARVLAPEPDAGRTYAIGAVGEEKVGASLDRLGDRGVMTLHDRRLPRSTANIDHLVVAPTGVWVVDTKRYSGRLQRSAGGLRVNGRDRTSLILGVHKQLDHVRRALGRAGDDTVAVQGLLCFVDTEIGLLQRPFEVQGVAVTWPKALAKLLVAPGPLTADDRAVVLQHLAGAFRPAL